MLKLLLKTLNLKPIHFANLYLWDTQDPEISQSPCPLWALSQHAGDASVF